MSKFQRAAIDYFKNEVGPGMIQRIDGVAVFSPLTNFWFWRFRLNRMARRGLLIKRSTHSIWPSCDGMPAYGIVEQEGREDAERQIAEAEQARRASPKQETNASKGGLSE